MSRKDKVRNGMPFGDKRVFESLTCQSAIKVSLYKCTVLSVFRLYGSETWTLANPCHLRSKDSSSASFATHFAATRRIVWTDRFALYAPSDGRRSVGGQKLLFLQYISRVIEGGSVKPTDMLLRPRLLESSGCRLPGQPVWPTDETWYSYFEKDCRKKKCARDNPER